MSEMQITSETLLAAGFESYPEEARRVDEFGCRGYFSLIIEGYQMIVTLNSFPGQRYPECPYEAHLAVYYYSGSKVTFEINQYEIGPDKSVGDLMSFADKVMRQVKNIKF